VREPPAGVTDAEILAAVREAWEPSVSRVEHVPLGFGAHHWAAYDVRGPLLFVTLDRLEPKRSAAQLEAAYAGTEQLRGAGLEFVLSPVRSRPGGFTVTLATGALSCTPWHDGSCPETFDLAWTTDALGRLHAATPPSAIPEWTPLVAPDFAGTTAALVGRPWGPGPHADDARQAVTEHVCDIARWTARYHHLADAARERTWVATHGEPHSDNQLLSGDEHFLVDWESLKLAPAERDLRALLEAGSDVEVDPAMVEMFDLEWRLDEISQYAAWFAAPHAGTRDDEIAFGGLLHELTRVDQAATSG
jgi:spectinomycin phosphotransferase